MQLKNRIIIKFDNSKNSSLQNQFSLYYKNDTDFLYLLKDCNVMMFFTIRKYVFFSVVKFFIFVIFIWKDNIALLIIVNGLLLKCKGLL